MDSEPHIELHVGVMVDILKAHDAVVECRIRDVPAYVSTLLQQEIVTALQTVNYVTDVRVEVLEKAQR